MSTGNVLIRLTGVAPLLQHNARLSDPTDPYSQRMKAITSKRTKTDEDLQDLARLEWEGGLYYDPDLGPYIPGSWLEACLREAAKATRQGKSVIRAVIVVDEMSPLLYRGPRDIEGLWAAGTFASRMSVRNQQNRVIRVRPRFDEWEAEFGVLLDEQLLNFDDLLVIAERAGRSEGIGDYRPRYGRFTAEVKRA